MYGEKQRLENLRVIVSWKLEFQLPNHNCLMKLPNRVILLKSD